MASRDLAKQIVWAAGRKLEHVAGTAEVRRELLDVAGQLLERLRNEDESDLEAKRDLAVRHPRLGRISLLVCGEICLLGGGGSVPARHRQAVLHAGLPKNWHEQTRLFVNPAHVTGMPQAVRDKRAWLAKPAQLVATANLTQGTWQQWDADYGAYYPVKRSAWTAAEAYRKKQSQTLQIEAASSSYNIKTLSMNP